MELRQLEYFVAVVEEANFTRAAQRVRVAQPAVSAQIQRLERELGQELLDRSRRAVRLTAAGAAVLPYARAALAAVAGARTAVDELADLVRGSVAIATVTAHDVDIPSLLAQFHTAHPAVEITLGADNSDVLLERLRTGRLDLAIVSIGPDEQLDDIATEVVTDEAIEAAVGAGDDLAAHDVVSLTALREWPLISLPPGTGIRRQLDAACAAAGFTPRIAFEASTPPALADLAERGLGVAILPSSVSRSRPGLHALTIEPPMRGRLVLAWRSRGPMSPAARELVKMARRLLAVGAPA
ncbi:LysR family transcriptional regulator [Mycolicibacterium wolinskyi]|uniref:Probable hydrogen peroxide-inducible genes activator n=1 Tax=Mycolicibacterium wolinskyi TaxID=59750 RepID=A0A1X2EVY7_9MYCO|nr:MULTISPECIES: LysR family transcriptional regulator [Mycolicibacterium]MCV7289666.1 LysR family transcriptional regulator [Mycolicibacterium wolinskyi]MCV7296637.1 LysR family transcriptional regulator [Mycolicibacterium goodii]ORX10208.1 LysR family transcriptional regulator [Mycolicibacterium wolinskyi]